MRVTSVLSGLRLSFPEQQGIDCNVAALNSLFSPFWSESQMLARCRLVNVRFHGDLSGMKFSAARLLIDIAEVEFSKDGGGGAPRLEKGLEARLLNEWYGESVDQFSASARIFDGMVISIDRLRLICPTTTDGSSLVVEASSVLSVTCDEKGREVGLQQCWEDVPADPPSRLIDEKVVRKQVSAVAACVQTHHLRPVALSMTRIVGG